MTRRAGSRARVDKPGTIIPADAPLEVRGSDIPFVSRGGLKLDAALSHWEINVTDRMAVDIGASTGGFTDCLLQRGAARVVALDVGHGLLDATLRADPRVEVIERVNARHLPRDLFREPFDLVTVDVSFISATKVAPALLSHVAPGGLLLVLVKPQFEAERRSVGRGGVLRDETARREVVARRAEEIAALGFSALGLFDSPVAGAEGNRETFALFRRPAAAAPAPSAAAGAGA